MSDRKGLKPIDEAYISLIAVQNNLEQYLEIGIAIPVEKLKELAERQRNALKIYRDTISRARRILENGVEDE